MAFHHSEVGISTETDLQELDHFITYPIWLLREDEFFDSDDVVTMIIRIVATITYTGSWLFPAETWPTNPVSWTVNTLFFFYLAFPFILPRVQKMSHQSLSRWIVYLLYIQVLPFAIFSLAYWHLGMRI